MEDNNLKHFLTPLEVAHELQLNLLTIYHYIHQKKLMVVKIGRNYRIDRKDFEKFIEANKM